MSPHSPPGSTRQVLLDSAKRLLWKHGYEAMSPRRILAESGAGQGSLYHHFPGKAALAAAALEEVAAEMTEAMDALFEGVPEPLAAVHRFLDIPFDPLKGCRLGRLANEAAVADPETADPALRAPLDRFFAAARTRIADALDRAAAEGRLHPGQDREMLATTMLAAVQGGFVLSRIHQDPASMRQAVAGAHLLLDSVTREPGP
ncbi:TetR/AcrR family transcriptional regulator [Marinibaculum pumilum]|uniref:TetR/AcrR family transcriptional regulator n=1 Tax=Marinibaculum pumilum TaxID=1766165 RepID=A0ABV7L7Z9_9PROT